MKKNKLSWKKAITTTLLLIATNALYAQHEAYTDSIWHSKSKQYYDSSNLWFAFKNGTMSGQFRQFTMATINDGSYPDYYAIAIGGGIRYQTASFHQFKFTISGYFIHNLSSNNLGEADATTGVKNRYEIGLFDIENPDNKSDLDRLEELHIMYTNKNFTTTFGKQIINTPFINPQDGRMRPTEVAGLWTKWSPRNTKIMMEGGWLSGISPRSTVKWYAVSESMGIYPQGVNPDGSKSGYKGALSSAGIGYISSTITINKLLSFQVAEQYVENIFNTILFQTNFQQPVKSGQLIAAAQYTRQHAIRNGGNADLQKTYFTPGSSSNIFSGKIGFKNKKWQTAINYTKIFKGGRFLMPREWGKEPFFTFLPRERMEGLSNANAWMAKATRKFEKASTSLDLGIGIYNLPDATDFTHNKYGMPSYGQANLNINYTFKGFFRGLQADLLYAYKWNRGDTHNNPKLIVNKVNMSNINLIFNFHF